MKEKTITSRYNPEESDRLDSIISESYDSFVRLERRNLLAVSSVIFLSYFGGATPSSANLPFIEFPNLNVTMLFAMLSLTCLYFLIAFSIYAYPGYRASKKNWKLLTSRTLTITSNFHRFHIEKHVVLSTSRFYIWLFFNYILPVILGVISLLMGLYKIYILRKVPG